MSEHKKLISVSDINAWLYCSRKVYLHKICGLQIGQNRNMAIGMIKHKILEDFSKKEQGLVEKFDENFDNLDLVFMYQDFIKTISKMVFVENRTLIDKFLIDPEDILKKVLRDFGEDIKLRVKTIKDALNKGYKKETLWKNLDSIYLSEIKLESEELGLKGRVDRILISRKDNSVIPFELKSREERIFLSDELQLTAYAMLLEQQYSQKILKGIVEVGNNKQEIEISEEKRKEVLKIAEEIRNLNEGQIPPIQSNFNKCRNCEFREECMKI
jgi:CRISPR-associated protein Cas4